LNLNSKKSNSVFVLVCLALGALVSCQSIDKRTSQPVKMVKDIPVNPRVEQGQLKKRLMILPLNDSKSILSDEMNMAIKKTLIKELNKSQEVIAFDSKDLGIEKVKVSPAGGYELKDVVKSLKEYTVHSALEAEIKELKVKRSVPTKGIMKGITSEYECSIVVRVINQSGRELLNHMKVVTYKDTGLPSESDLKGQSANPIVPTLIKDTLFEFIPQITKSLETMVWEGRIASLQGERIFLNVGKVSGLNVGDLLRVTEDGEEIFDTETGQFIGKSPGRLKGTLEVVSFFGQDGAIAVIHSGGGFRENDRVELY
jgi:hypothetical protein